MQFPCDDCPYANKAFTEYKDPDDALTYLDNEFCYKCGKENEYDRETK